MKNPLPSTPSLKCHRQRQTAGRLRHPVGRLDRRVRFRLVQSLPARIDFLLAAVIPLLRIPVWPRWSRSPLTVALPATEWTAEVVEEAAPAVTPETVCLTVYLIGSDWSRGSCCGRS